MKILLKIFVLFLLTINLNAETFSVFMENDVIDGSDKHYTNGTAFMYLSNKDTNDLEKYDNKFYELISKIPTFHKDTKYQSFGITYSHLAFTPSDLKNPNKIVGDLPYAGVITLDFTLYKWEEDFFHEYMLTLGMVGPSTKTEQFQKEYHRISGSTKPQGWHNQLEDDFLYNFAYSFGYKAYQKNFGNKKFDVINSIRFDVGNYNRAVNFGSMLRYGKNYPSNFNTVGRFLGSNENKVLNLDSKTTKSYAWSISYGLAYTYTDFFYVNDHDKSYDTDQIQDTITQVIAFDTYFEKYVISFTFKSSNFIFEKQDDVRQNWGSVNLAYLF